MYRKILIPSDGSPLSLAAALAGVELAQRLSAEIISLYVAPQYQYPVYVELVPPDFPSEQEFEASMRRTGIEYLEPIKQAAINAGLHFRAMTAFSDAPARQIVDTAQHEGCDLIFMGSHGRSGWGQILLGSVTNKVLSSCAIAVLVHRLQHAPH
jgi:nucleotide-binding universal stress UspA family protein